MSKLIDNCGREINYLRISVTDRCNLRCKYCMPPEGVEFIPHGEILCYEEIREIVKAGAKLGLTKIRLTGGEPLVRKGVEDLIELLREIPEIEEIALTTNGVLLPELGGELARAGLDRVNISLDTLSRDKFKDITGDDKFDQVWKGIKTALEERLTPVKLNVVVIKGVNDDEIMDFVNLTVKHPLHVRFIEFMPPKTEAINHEQGYLSIDKIKEKITAEKVLKPIQIKNNSGPASVYKFKDSLGTVGFINSVSSHFCGNCNRLRLTSTGELRPCLYSTQAVDVKEVVRSGGGIAKLQAKFKEAVAVKGKFSKEEKNKLAVNMSEIGG